jgi:diacyltrehalose acyltransferase
MTPSAVRWLGVGALASACAGLLAAASTLNAASAFGDDASAFGDNTALILGHAFLPTPDESYITQVMDTYIDPTPAYFSGQPVYPVDNAIGVTTPETDYDSGLTTGVADLNTAIEQQLAAGNDDLVVFSYSMSTSIATQEMINLAASGDPDSSGLTFILAEDLNNPDGGIFTRFPGIGGVTLPATPADTPYTTDVYTIEYSGASDFPQYSSDLLADLNAADGYLDLHPYLLAGWPAYFTPSELAGAVQEPTSGADTTTDYFIIPTQDLPLLNGLRPEPGAASPFADLIQPDLRVLVDLGYDWTGDADVDTPAESTSPDIDTTAVDADLAAGADQGMIAALVDLGILPQSDLSDLYPDVPDIAGLESSSLSPLTSDAVATADASESASALVSDLANSTSPLAAELSAILPGVATDLADMFANSLPFLFF